ncbi:DUF4054 domain-containing protein [Aeromonas jandaei]|nr:DUF4054 domain-containing protein [Aeromonas jandaei]
MHQNFRDNFPQFSDKDAYPDALIEIAKQKAAPKVGGRGWTEERRQQGLLLLVAHYLACDPEPFEHSRFGQEFKHIRPKHVALAL